jgi:hypothetical protein
MFKEVYRVLKPGGLCLCLSLHIHFNIMAILGMGFHWHLSHARLPNPSYKAALDNSERHTLAVAHKMLVSIPPESGEATITCDSDSDVYSSMYSMQLLLNDHDSRSLRLRRSETRKLETQQTVVVLEAIQKAHAKGFISKERKRELKVRNR